jgi:hypothetical protein
MTGGYVFTCASCSEEVVVDEDVRRLILEEGCAVCGAPATARAFTRNESIADE